jgi:hypothetical protein
VILLLGIIVGLVVTIGAMVALERFDTEDSDSDADCGRW